MKNFIKIYNILTLASLFFVACGGGGGDDDIITSSEFLNVTSQIAIAGDGIQKGQLQISADCNWIISGAPSWMSLSINSGSGNATIDISCTPNPSSSDERSAVLTVKSASGKISKLVTVTQAVSAETITTNLDSFEFTSDGGTKTLSIQSNTSWNISGVEDWISLSRTEGNGNVDITITISKNEEETTRNAVITVQGNNNSVQVAIKQEGRITTFSISPTEINAIAKTSTYKLKIEGDASWSASVNFDWCSLNKLNGTGDEELSLTVADNTAESEREAVITFTTNKNSILCKVAQAGGKLPTVVEVSVTDVQKYQFVASSYFESEFPVTECGFCYSLTKETPTIADSKVNESTSAEKSNFSLTISSLDSGKTYYVRAYAKSAVGVGYGKVLSITTKGSMLIIAVCGYRCSGVMVPCVTENWYRRKTLVPSDRYERG